MVTKQAFQHKRPTSNVYVARKNTLSYYREQPIQDFSDNPPQLCKITEKASPCQQECSDLSFLSSEAFPGPPIVSNMLLVSLQAEMQPAGIGIYGRTARPRPTTL